MRLRKRLAQIKTLAGERPEVWHVLAGMVDALDEIRARLDRIEAGLRNGKQ
jgi:hypothetical protein